MGNYPLEFIAQPLLSSEFFFHFPRVRLFKIKEKVQFIILRKHYYTNPLCSNAQTEMNTEH